MPGHLRGKLTFRPTRASNPDTCWTEPCSPWSPSFAPPTPQPIPRCCSQVSSLLRRSLTSPRPFIIGYGSSPSQCAPVHAATGQTEISRSPCKERPCVPGLRPRRVVEALAFTRPFLLPSAFSTASAPGIAQLSQLNGWPARFPTDASPTTSRWPAHGSGPMWFAIPSSQWTCTTDSLPVSRRTQNLWRMLIDAPSWLAPGVMVLPKPFRPKFELSLFRTYPTVRKASVRLESA